MRLVFLLALLITFSGPAFGAQGAGGRTTDITYIEQLHFDGTKLNVVYGLSARCANPADHLTGIRLEPYTYPTKGYRVVITDQESKYCNSAPMFIRLAETLNLRAEVDRKRYRDNSPYTLTFPPVTYTSNPPQPWNPVGGAGSPTPSSPQTTQPTGDVNSYVWRCTLWKRDGAKRDGFEGIDAELARARQYAANGCQRTNNPNCDYWSRHPDHTTCEAIDENSNQLARINVEWSCTLWKRDGAKRDGFTGTGNTEDNARAQAAKGCNRTNNPRCVEWSRDPDHTACDAKMQP